MRNPTAAAPLLGLCATLALALTAGCASASLGARCEPPVRPLNVMSASPKVAPGTFERAVAASRVVFVGEQHGDPAHHALELYTLCVMNSSRSGAPLLLGMEMFQRPFQQHLDDYVAGRIDEREMLRRTQYFDRWRFDYTAYAPLWRFARQHGIRVVALNAEASIVRKIGKEGLSGLTPDERAQIAEQIDLDVKSHRERIEGFFNQGAHRMSEAGLKAMYEAQTTWDETMAESAARALAQAGPDARMMIMAGAFHIQERDPIPARLLRRIGDARSTIVVGRSQSAAPESPAEAAELGDFVVVLPDKQEVPAVKLGVVFDETRHWAGLRVKAVVTGGTASKAGIEEGDVITALGREPITDMVDVRYVLDALDEGDRVTATVMREGAPRELQLVMAPPPAPPHP